MTGSKKKLLIVDDEYQIRMLLKEVFLMEYSDIDTAEHGAAGIEKLSAKQYDIVITDVIMPEITGIDVLKFAKEKYDDIIVLIITGHASLDMAIKAVNLGADEFVTKPFRNENMLAIVRKHLRSQALGRENIELHKQIAIDRERLKKNLVELSLLYDLTKSLSYNFEIIQVYINILQSLSKAVECDYCALYARRGNILEINSEKHLRKHQENRVSVSIKQFLESELVTSINIDRPNIQYTYDSTHLLDDKEVQEERNILLKHGENVLGILHIAKLSGDKFSKDDESFLNRIAEDGAGLFSRLQQVIESQKSKVERVIDQVPDSIVVYNQLDDTIIVNPAGKEVLKRSGSRRCNKEEVERHLNTSFVDLLKLAEKENKPFKKELYHESDQNTRTVYDAHISLLSGADALPEGFLMVLRDVTAERELIRLKSEFISNISHELRTPAAVIKEFISIMHQGIGGELTEKQTEYTGIMKKNIDRLLRLINNLLQINKIESGERSLRKRKIIPQMIVNMVTSSMKVRFKEKNITLKEDIQADLPALIADQDAIIQILTNILDNARKFSPDNSEITLKVCTENNNFVASVEDHGRGIPEADLVHVFDRFYRGEYTEEVREEGSGLGLAIVKEFVNLHDGDISVESKLGEGTKFQFYIPIIAETGKGDK